MHVYYEKDADLSIIQGRKVAIIGYGSQGHAHANNLKDSGVSVVVGLRKGSGSWAKAEKAGLAVAEVAEAVTDADVVMVLTPDELQPAIYREAIEPNLKAGALYLWPWFNIHFSLIEPKADVDVIMIAPKGPGHTVRGTYTQGGGVPCLIAVAQDATGMAKSVALSYAAGIGGARAGVIETNFQEETETDLFGEQAVLCGGVTSLMPGFETLVEAGYAPEMAYFGASTNLSSSLIYSTRVASQHVVLRVWQPEYGGLTRGPRVVPDSAKAEMKKILEEIQTGRFAREFVTETQAGSPSIKAMRKISQRHEIEEVGDKLRGMMPWIQQNRLVDREVN